MVRLSPFCDNDHRHSLQFFAGVNLIMCGISIIVDLLVIAEVSHFYEHWNYEELNLSPASVDLALIIDILIIAMQIFYGCELHSAVSEGAYSKIRRWRIPSSVLLVMRMIGIVFYIISMPISPYHWYFTSIVVVYSVFLYWPVSRFLHDFGSIPTTENTRLLRPVN